MEFAASKSNLKAVHCQIKFINPEVAFIMLTRSGTFQTYCAIPHILLRKCEENLAEVVATGEVASSPAIQTYLAAMGYLAREGSKHTLCVVLHKNCSVQLFLGYNKKTMKELMYSGPAGIVSLMGVGDQYHLNDPKEIQRLIKHIGCALQKIIKENQELKSIQRSKRVREHTDPESSSNK